MAVLNRLMSFAYTKKAKKMNRILVYSQTGYDVTCYFQSAFIKVKKVVAKMSPPKAMGRISIHLHYIR